MVKYAAEFSVLNNQIVLSIILEPLWFSRKSE